MFNEGKLNLGANRPEASEAEIDFTEEEKEEAVDLPEEQEAEESARREADAIFEEQELEAAAEAAEAAETAAREQRIKEAIEMEREGFEEAAAATEKSRKEAEERRLLDELYTDTPEEKFAEIGPQRAGHLWKEHYRNSKKKQKEPITE